MSYSFSLTQFPTKEFYALWSDLLSGKLYEFIDKKIEELEKQQTHVDSPKGTWETNNAEWVAYRKQSDARLMRQGFIWSWENLKKTIQEQLKKLEQSKNDRDKKDIIKECLETFEKLFGEQNIYAPRILLVEGCAHFSEDARSNAYFFLRYLFLQIHHLDLDETKASPTLAQWHELYQALKAPFFEKAFTEFCEKEYILPVDQERTRRECLELLFAIKDLVKTCIEKDWDLWLESGYSETESNKKQKEVLKECFKIYEKKRINT